MSSKLWVSLVLIVLGLIGIFTLVDIWQLIAVVVLGVGLILLIMATVGAKKQAPPPISSPLV